VNQALASLKQAAARINQTATQADEIIRSTNERLRELGAGAEFYWGSFLQSAMDAKRINEGEENERTYAHWNDHSLCYGKIQGTWQLGCRWEEWEEYEDDNSFLDRRMIASEVTPLHSANRELRILMAAALPKFLTAYTEHLNKLADELSKPDAE